MKFAIARQLLGISMTIVLWTLLVLPSVADETAFRQETKWATAVELPGVPNCYRVADGLYRSAQPTACGMKRLKEELGIETVISLRSFHSDRDEIGETGLGYERIYMKAWHPEDKEAIRFLQIVTNPKRQPVLVHCQRGADRTGALCAVYRIVVEGWSKEEAIREMTEGPFGFNPLWFNLVHWVHELDVEELRGKLAEVRQE